MEGIERKGTVKIAGFGEYTDVIAQKFICSGSGRITGNIDVEIAKTAGACEIGGSVSAKIFNAAGACSVGGNIKAEEIHTAGSFKCNGSIEARQVEIAGAAKVRGNLNAEQISWAGELEVGGCLKATKVCGKIDGKSKVEEIVADEVCIERARKLLPSMRQELRVKTITGKTIQIENTKAEYVKGEKVIVGQGCEIKVVDAGEVKVHKKAKVETLRK